MDKFKIALNIFKVLTNKIQTSTTEYIGTKEFKGYSIYKVVESTETGEVLIGGDDKEFSIAMSEATNNDLRPISPFLPLAQNSEIKLSDF